MALKLDTKKLKPLTTKAKEPIRKVFKPEGGRISQTAPPIRGDFSRFTPLTALGASPEERAGQTHSAVAGRGYGSGGLNQVNPASGPTFEGAPDLSIADPQFMQLDPNLGGNFNPLNPGMPQPGMPELPYMKQGYFNSPYPYGGSRRHGGRVRAGTLYEVNEDGEHKKEYFKPDVDGTIMPADEGNKKKKKKNDTPPAPVLAQQIEKLTDISNAALAGQRYPEYVKNPRDRFVAPLQAEDPTGFSSRPVEGPGISVTGGLGAPTPEYIAPDPTPPKVPATLLDWNIQQKRGALNALRDRGEAHVSKGASALSYLFQGMEKYAGNVMGRQTGPIVPLGQQRFAREIATSEGNLTPLLAQKAQDIQFKGQEAQARGAEGKNRAQEIDNIFAANPSLALDIKAGRITPQTIALAEKAGLYGLEARDDRDQHYIKINGQWYSTPKVGGGGLTPIGPVDPTEAPVQVQHPDGFKYHVKGGTVGEEAYRIGQIEVAKLKAGENTAREYYEKNNTLENTDETERIAALNKEKIRQTKVAQLRAEWQAAENTYSQNAKEAEQIRDQINTENQKGSLFADTTKLFERLSKLVDDNRALEAKVSGLKAEAENSKPDVQPTPSKKLHSRAREQVISSKDIIAAAKKLNISVDEAKRRIEANTKRRKASYKIVD